MKIFGFNYDLFISSICYLDGSKLQFATPEERLIREKNTRDFPHKSLSYVLNKYQINIDNVDYFVSSFNPGVYFNKFKTVSACELACANIAVPACWRIWFFANVAASLA